MLELIILATLIVVFLITYKVIILPTLKRLQETAAQREEDEKSASTPFIAKPETATDKASYHYPSIVAGRLSKHIIGGGGGLGFGTRRADKKNWPGLQVGETAQHEEMVQAQHNIYNFYEQKREKRILTPGEMKYLISSADERWQPLLATACYAGLKANEICGLLWEDIDFEKGTINVERTFGEDGRFHDNDPDAQKRSVIVPPIVLEALKEHKQCQEENHIDTSHCLVFTGLTGKALNPRVVTERIFDPALERARMRKIHFEDLRLSYDAALTKAGESLAFIQKQMGYPQMEEAGDASDGPKKPLSELERGAHERLARIFDIRLPEEKAS